jgi:hypothetical protein
MSKTEVNAAILKARDTCTLDDYRAARAAVEAMAKGRARTVYTQALGRLPLADVGTRLIALAVERTADMQLTRPAVVGEENGSMVLSLRRTSTETARTRGSRAAMTVVTTVDTASGSVALSSATLTHDWEGVGDLSLPLNDGQLDVRKVRGMSADSRHTWAVAAAMVATGTELQSPPSPPLPLG